MEGEKGVVLLDYWSSPYSMRVKIALAEKGVNYECREEHPQIKSSFLLQMNPINKMVPVLIHNGKPICESLNIVHYIDQVWYSSSPLLPSDPYQRSRARFWANFVDDKIFDFGKNLTRAKGERLETITKEYIESLKVLERELKDNKFFGGDTFGYVDVALVPLASWFYALEKCGSFSIADACPKLMKWADLCKERPSVSSSLPDPEKIYNLCYIFTGKKKCKCINGHI